MLDAGLEPLGPCVYPSHSPANNDRALFEHATHLVAEHLAAHLSQDEPVEAIMALTDGDIYVLAAACRLLGKEPNQDVLFVGYDHYWEDAKEREIESTTPLATVDKRNSEIGAALVQLLIKRITGRLDAKPYCHLLAPRLVIH
jgi:DNA-binding LacI/PurR family transcriptional regulator